MCRAVGDHTVVIHDESRRLPPLSSRADFTPNHSWAPRIEPTVEVTYFAVCNPTIAEGAENLTWFAASPGQVFICLIAMMSTHCCGAVGARHPTNRKNTGTNWYFQFYTSRGNHGTVLSKGPWDQYAFY